MTATTLAQIQLASNPFERPKTEVTRFTMHRRLVGLDPIRPMPKNYSFSPWNEKSTPAFASILRTSFIKSPELQVYPSLGTMEGCSNFVEEMTVIPGFIPEASWMISWHDEPVAAILTHRTSGWIFGEIQVIAVVPRHRRVGLATNLVRMALWEFVNQKLPHSILSLNHTNRRTIRFFRKLGFQVNGSGTYM